MLSIVSLYGWDSVTIRFGWRHHPAFLFIVFFLLLFILCNISDYKTSLYSSTIK